MRNKEVLYLIIGLIVFTGCGDRPSNVLSDKEMVDLMVDMEIAEAYVNTQMGSGSKEKIEMGKRVMKAHGVSEETLDTTLAWYGRNMDSYSKLFEKVDKEIEKRKIKYTEVPGEKSREPDNLWPYGSHVILSPLSDSESLSFSISNPDLEKGEIIEFSYHMPNPATMKGVLGVEYTDGYGESLMVNFSSRPKAEISLPSDSSKVISRIFGIMSVKTKNAEPFYLDSISLKATPIDTLTYRSQRRSLKKYGPLL